MDILLRDIDAVAVQKIDELAKKKGVSRNEYLRQILENYSVLTAQNSIINHLEKQIETNNILLAETTKTLDELVSILKELINVE